MGKIMRLLIQSPPAFLVLVQTEDMHLEILVKICTMFINNLDHLNQSAQDSRWVKAFYAVSVSISRACSNRRHALGNTGENMYHVH